jgi:DNA-directed RNA polymerase subunit RPC12/RpoP
VASLHALVPRRLGTDWVHDPTVPELEAIALDLTCAECGRSPRAGETFLFADKASREAYVFCPECAEREFD